MPKEIGKKRRKLNNVALAFPVAAGKADSRVFRIYCKLNEPVVKNVLEHALKKALGTYPLFQCSLKRGNFWYYFEKNDFIPEVIGEKEVPCGPLYKDGAENALYQLSFHENRISLEIFHALTDGTGAIEFLSEIVKQYLHELHGVTSEEEAPAGISEQEEDSFFRYYSSEKQEKQRRKSGKAYQITGKKVRQNEMRILECTLSVQKLLACARGYGVSVTEYLTAVLMQAISKDAKKTPKKPVTIMIPVNLRKYYPSRSMSNFFGWMEIEYDFNEPLFEKLEQTLEKLREKEADRDDRQFRQILTHVRKRFTEDLTKEQVAARMNHYIAIERNPMLKYIPLRIKNVFLKLGTVLGSRNVTAVFSNMGIIRLPACYAPYIDQFGVIASTDKLQICACSYYDRFYFSLTSKYRTSEVQKYVLERLKRDGLRVTIETGEK